MPRPEAADDVPLRQELPCEPWRLGDARGVSQGAEESRAGQQRTREAAEEQARYAAQSGDEYDELLAEGTQYQSKDDTRKAGKAYREAIALKPNKPGAYYDLGAALCNSGHVVEAA